MITNYVVPVPGTTVTAFLGIRDAEPTVWIYSLWEGEGDDETSPDERTLADERMLATGRLDLSPLTPTPEQVARIAFILEIEYGTEDS